MLTIERIISFLAFLVFGIIGQVIVFYIIYLIDVEYVLEDLGSYLKYSGFAIGFLVFGFFYLNNIIEKLKKKRQEDKELLMTKNEIIERLDKTLHRCEQKVKIAERENMKYAGTVSDLLQT